MIIGIPLGIFIAVLAAFMFYAIISVVLKGLESKNLSAVMGYIAGIAGFGLGGTWLSSGSILNGTNIPDILPSYLCSFTSVFVLLCAYIIYKLAFKFGQSVQEDAS